MANENKNIQAGQPIQIPLNDLLKKSMVQLKYEEFGSWLAMHRTPLFYAHKNGFTVVDEKFINDHKDLKKALDKMVKEFSEKHSNNVSNSHPIDKSEKKEASYIG